MLRIACIVGARPNFVKMAAIMAAASERPEVNAYLVHTGQHYDPLLSDVFFEELGLHRPDVSLGVGSASHAVQTARVMEGFDKVLDDRPADVVLVVGDVNSTLACALVAAKRHVKVAHVEAGLRSGDRRMPEEVNRILTDQLSDYLFTTERSAAANLATEGIPAERVHFVGNVMIDTLLRNRPRAAALPVLADLGLTPRGYAVITLHRPSNVDTEQAARNTLQAVRHVCDRVPCVWPMHPRTSAQLGRLGLLEHFRAIEGLRVVEPMGYLAFLALVDGARLVFTDSGGIQEETTVLGVPCLTFRDNTERPITVREGTNRLLGTSSSAVGLAVGEVLSAGAITGRAPELWDGGAAARILAVLARPEAL